MKKFVTGLLLSLCLVTTSVLSAEDTGLSLETLGKAYFEAWQQTQMPDAKPEAIENYLDFLADDVGHQHLPYDPDASRLPDGKSRMREGMSYYLGVHTSYESELLDLIIGHQVIIIKYQTSATGIHPQTKRHLTIEDLTIEVLEIENGKIAVIRKYSD